MSGVLIPACFSLPQTLDCGQAFRWRETEENCWEGAAFGAYLKLRLHGDEIEFCCTNSDFDNVWHKYFDLDTDYSAMRTSLSSFSPVLSEAISYAPGIRILRQDSWEALCSFLISQNNNIPRIKGIITRLCELCGKPIPGSNYYSFPTAQAVSLLTPEDLAPIRSGFRAKYLVDAARRIASGEINLKKIALSPVEYGKEELQKILGVGPKVAQCALLYGFHKTECFPLDVWMKRAMAELLPTVSPEDFGENAGLAQQYIFHYSRMHPELFKENSEEGAKAERSKPKSPRA